MTPITDQSPVVVRDPENDVVCSQHGQAARLEDETDGAVVYMSLELLEQFVEEIKARANTELLAQPEEVQGPRRRMLDMGSRGDKDG